MVVFFIKTFQSQITPADILLQLKYIMCRSFIIRNIGADQLHFRRLIIDSGSQGSRKVF